MTKLWLLNRPSQKPWRKRHHAPPLSAAVLPQKKRPLEAPRAAVDCQKIPTPSDYLCECVWAVLVCVAACSACSCAATAWALPSSCCP